MGTLIQDLKFGFRTLGRNPGFTAVAVVTLAIGIGVNVALFSVLNDLFLRPLPVRQPSQIVELGFGQRGAFGEFNFSYPDFRDIRDHDTSFSGMLAYRFGFAGIGDGRSVERVSASFVTGNYFTLLGLKPALGRLILPSDGNVASANPVIVLGYSYWQSRFGGSPSVIGRQVSLDGHAVTIIGVAPKGFRGLLSVVDMQAYVPIHLTHIWGSSNWFNWRDYHILFVLARLKRGVTLPQAQASLNVIANRLSRQYPKTDAAATPHVFPQREARLSPKPQPGQYKQLVMAFGLFLGLAAVLLLLACFNVANILLVRATSREHEMAIRSALGAGRSRLSRQVLTESLLLAFLGGGAGILAGTWACSLLSSIHLNIGIPYQLDFTLDWRVLAYALAATVVAGFVVGGAPALHAARTAPGDALHSGEGRSVAGGRNKLRNALVILQVAASVVLLIAAGLFSLSLASVQRINLGFNPHHLLNLTMNLHQAGYSQTRGREFYKELLARVRALPGVRSASLAALVPLGASENDDAIYIEGQPPIPGRPATRLFDNQVSPGYFETMQIPLLRGRGFTEADNESAPLVAVINQEMARRFWPNQNPIGKQFRLDSESNPWTQVVGVAKDGKYQSVLGETLPYFYLPLAQDYSALQTLQVRTAEPPAAMAREVDWQIHELAPNLPVFGVHTMDEALDSPYGLLNFQIGAGLAAAIGILGLILAVIGVYGVVSYAASRRTREIGIRVALGARTGDIMRMVFGQGALIVGLGVVFGLFAACAVAQTLKGFLFGVSAYDPLTFICVAVLLALVSLLACYLPARRAAKVDPMVALRHE